MKRKIVSILLCLAVCMAMMPTMGYATTEYYRWKVAGIDVTSDNADNITGQGITLAEGGNVSYDADSNTLTLKDATIEAYGAGIECASGNNKPPTIVIEGDNKINASSYGIAPFESTVSNLMIKSEDGKGSLEVEGISGINCGNRSNSVALTLSNVKVEATGTNGYGIYTKGNITLENAVVEVTGTFTKGTDNDNYCGIKSDGTLTLIKSSITAKRGNESSRNIEATGGIIAEEAEITGAYYSDTKNVFTSGETKKLWSINEITLRNNFKEYGLWVGGVQVAEKNKGNVLADANKTVSYDADTNTLTLNNATITGCHTDGSIATAIRAMDNEQNITIKLKGVNSISNLTTGTIEEMAAYGIFSYSGSITIINGNEDGTSPSLTIHSNNDAIHSGDTTALSNVIVTATSTKGDGIHSDHNITIENANVTVTGVNGIQSGYDITAGPNSTVTAVGTTGYGIVANNNISLSNSDIEAKGNNGNAIVSRYGKITCTEEMYPIKNGTDVYAEGGFAHIIRAIETNNLVSLKRATNSLYYDTKEGKVYTSYDENTNTFSDPWDRGGITGSGNILTLDNLYFITTAKEALVIPGKTKSDTITINCEGKNTICAGYGYDGDEEDYGIKTDANLIIKGGTLSMVTYKVYSNIYAGGNIQLVDTDVTVRRFITGGELTLENAILNAWGYLNKESSPYSIDTTEGIYYYNDLYALYADSTIACGMLSDQNTISKLGKNGDLTLYSEAFAYFDANGVKWEDGNAYAIIRSEEKQANGERWITIPDAPTRNGYNFIGWFTKAEGGTQITGNKVKYSGSTERKALVEGHNFKKYAGDPNNTYYAHWKEQCKGEHNFGDWTITKQPTATEKGSKERVCSVCQYKETAEIPATGGSTSGGGSTVTPVQKPEIQPVSGGKTSLSKDGSTLEITPDEGMEIGTVTVNGKEVTVKDGKITGLKTGDKVQVTFKAKASTKEAMDQKVAETVKDLSLTVRTSRTENRNVRATVQADSKLNAAVQEFKAAGYTVKYKFYRSTKKASGFKRMLTKDTNAYVNTMGDQGTYYYYKARLAVYDAEGKLVAQTALKQCKAGNRLWIK